MPGPMLTARSSLKAKGDTRLRSDDVRFTPKSGHLAGPEECPLSAKSGHQ